MKNKENCLKTYTFFWAPHSLFKKRIQWRQGEEKQSSSNLYFIPFPFYFLSFFLPFILLFLFYSLNFVLTLSKIQIESKRCEIPLKSLPPIWVYCAPQTYFLNNHRWSDFPYIYTYIHTYIYEIQTHSKYIHTYIHTYIHIYEIQTHSKCLSDAQSAIQLLKKTT